MFEFIDCRYVHIEQFQLEEGYQPKNSLFYITDGCFDYEMNGVYESAKANELILFPDNVYFKRRIREALSFYYIKFENPNELPLCAGKIFVSEQRRIISTLNYLTEFTKMPTSSVKMKNHFLMDIFYQAEADRALTESHNDPLVRETEYYIQKNAERDITLNLLAAKAGVSVPTLIVRFKNAIGTTPIDYLIQVRIQKSEMLLCGSSLPISQIADMCGFENAYYFSNTFKKHTGLSPTEYRKKARP